MRESRGKKTLSLLLALLFLWGVFPPMAGADLSLLQDTSNSISVGSLPGVQRIITPTQPTCTYVFMVDGAEVDRQILRDGETLQQPESPAKEGARFTGWFENGSKLDFSKQVSVTASDDGSQRLVEAGFEALFFIRFIDTFATADTQDDAVITTKEFPQNQPANADGVLVVAPQGYGLVGWSQEAGPDGLGGADYDLSTPLIKNLDLFTKYAERLLVSFHTGGGVFVPPAYVPNGQPIPQPEDPTRAGYAFSHWSASENGPAYDFSLPVTQAMIIYAVWTPLQNIPYQVHHLHQNIYDDEYRLANAELRYGTSGEVATWLPRTYTGFKDPTSEPTVIKGDGSTVVEVKYDRRVYGLRFYDTNRQLINPPGAVMLRFQQDTTPYFQAANEATDNQYEWRDIRTWNYYANPPTITSSMTLEATVKRKGIVTVKQYIYHGSYENSTFLGEIVLVNMGLNQNFLPPGYYLQNHSNWGRIANGDLQPEYTSYDQHVWRYPDDDTGIIKIYYTYNKYKLSFATNGGPEIAPVTDITYATPLAPYEPSNYVIGETSILIDGLKHTFAGWYYNPNLVGVPFNWNGENAKMGGADLVMYAKWEIPKHTVTYFVTADLDGEYKQIKVPHLGLVSPGELSHEPEENFRAWYVNLHGAFVPYDFSAPIQSDLTLFPVWDKQSLRVSYDLNGATGTAPSDPRGYLPGARATALSPDGVTAPEGLVFLGWHTAKEGPASLQAQDAFVITGNMTLYAIWGPKNTPTSITYHPNGAPGQAITESLLNNQTHTAKAADTYVRPAYTFAGWNTKQDGSGLSVAAGSKVLVNRLNEQDNTLYAQWERILTTRTANKTWHLLPGETAPDLVIEIHRDGALYAQKVLPSGQTQLVVTDLPAQEEGTGREYDYELKEVVPAGYEGQQTPNGFENTALTREFKGTKTWALSENEQPVDVTLTLLRNGQPYRSLLFKAGETSFVFSDLPTHDAKGMAYRYQVREEPVPGFVASYSGLEGADIKNSQSVITVTVKKSWYDQHDQEGLRPKDIQVQLLADGQPLGQPFTLNADNGWQHRIENLLTHKKGQPIVYSARELAIPEGYLASVRPISADHMIRLINQHTVPVAPDLAHTDSLGECFE